MLHDVGKVGVPDGLLLKPGRLDAEERASMERHTLDRRRHPARLALAADPAGGARSRARTTSAGTAPDTRDGLRGEAIPLAARMCAVCDVFDALRSARHYKPPWTLEHTLAELTAERGRHFDPRLVDAFLALVPGLEPELLAEAGVPVPAIGEIGVATVGAAAPVVARTARHRRA